MIESKSLSVNPESENSTIELWENFGWALQSSQEVFNRNTVDLGDSTRTTTVNYVKLTFQRDTGMPNYTKLKELEHKYNELLDTYPTGEPRFNFILAAILLLFYIIPGVIYLVIYFKRKKKFNSEYSEWVELMNTEGKQCLEEVSSLIS